jgi:tRNA dimethylallyltransferase
MKVHPKIIVIVGPTASGKSDLAVEIALSNNGEVISADSRQVYTGLDIGTGKITAAEMKGVPHHLLDVVNPDQIFTVEDFKGEGKQAIKDIVSRGKVPIICGGTGFYIQALVDNLSFPEVQANPELRKKLEEKSTDELVAELQEKDADRAATIDTHNRVRIIRALEIVEAMGKVPPMKSDPQYDPLFIGITTSDEELKKRIITRLEQHLNAGMIEETQNLHKNGLSFERMEELGLEYRYLSYFLQNKISREELQEQLGNEIWQYAKRQKTWFKKDQRIHWFTREQLEVIERTIKDFLEKPAQR